jgi:hypothetical protein
MKTWKWMWMFLAMALVLLPVAAQAQVDSTVVPVDTVKVDSTAVNAVSDFVVAMLTGLLPGFPEGAAHLIGDLVGTVAVSFPVIPVVWLVGVLSAFLLKRIPVMAAWLSPYWERVRWWMIPLLAAIGSHFFLGSATIGLAAAGIKAALKKGLPALHAAIQKNTPEGIKHAGQVAVAAFLGLGLTLMLSSPSWAAGDGPSVFQRVTPALGVVAVQDSVGFGHSLHLRGAFKLVMGYTVRDHIGLRAFVTQPFTEGALRKPRPSMEAGVFWVF